MPGRLVLIGTVHYTLSAGKVNTLLKVVKVIGTLRDYTQNIF